MGLLKVCFFFFLSKKVFFFFSWVGGLWVFGVLLMGLLGLVWFGLHD